MHHHRHPLLEYIGGSAMYGHKYTSSNRRRRWRISGILITRGEVHIARLEQNKLVDSFLRPPLRSSKGSNGCHVVDKSECWFTIQMDQNRRAADKANTAHSHNPKPIIAHVVCCVFLLITATPENYSHTHTLTKDALAATAFKVNRDRESTGTYK